MVPRELRSASRPSPPLLLVAVGGSIGALVRHFALEIAGDGPGTILTLNVLGSLLIGVLTAWASHHRNASTHDESTVARWSALVGLGFCGGLTTFSTHVVEVATAFDDGAWSRGMMSLAATAVLAVAAAVAGHYAYGRRTGPGIDGSAR